MEAESQKDLGPGEGDASAASWPLSASFDEETGGAAPFQLDGARAIALLASVPSILYVYDVREQRSVYQNRALGEMLGYPAAQARRFRHEAWKRLIHPEDAARFPEHRARLARMRDGESVIFEYRMRGADGEWRWLQSRDEPLQRDADGTLRYVVGSTAEITEQKRTEAALRAHEERQELLIRELNHRVKNTLALVQSLALQSHVAAKSAQQFYTSFGARLRALTAAHEVLTRASWSGASLGELVREMLAPYEPRLDAARPVPAADRAATRIVTSGPAVRVSPERAVTLSMAFHELATNAVKYGALARPDGRLEIRWSARHDRELERRGSEPGPRGGETDQRRLELEWIERDGPAVTPPERGGFGSKLLERVVVQELGGRLECEYPPEGFRCRMTLPLAGSPLALE